MKERSKELFLLWLAAAFGLAVRLWGLGSLPLNFDEGATSYFAHLPFADLWGAPAALETNPPLFYSIERASALLFGNSAFVLRLACVVCGTAAILVAASIAGRLGGKGAALAAALLVASSSVCIQCSQDARCYAVLTLACLLAIAAQLSLFQAYAVPVPERPSRPLADWLLYVAACIAAIYLHNTAILVVIALNLTALLVWLTTLQASRTFALHWLLANAIVAAAYVPWLPIVARQSVHTLANFWLATPSLSDLRYAMMNIYAQPSIRWLQPLPDLVFIAAGIAGIAFTRKTGAAISLALVMLLGIPVASWAISQWRPIMNGKTLLWLAPLFLVFVAIGATRVRRLASPLTLLLVLLQCAACAGFFAARYDEAYPEVAALLRAKVRPGDAIFLDPPGNEILLDLYGWPKARLSIFVQPGPDPWFRSVEGTRLDAAHLAGLKLARLWVLTRAMPSEQLHIAQSLGGRMTLSYDQRFGHGRLRNTAPRNLELSLFQAPPV